MAIRLDSNHLSFWDLAGDDAVYYHNAVRRVLLGQDAQEVKARALKWLEDAIITKS